MIVLSGAVGAFSLAVLIATFLNSELLAWYVPISGLVMAVLLHAARRISKFLRVFIAMYSLGYLLLASLSLLGGLKLLPAAVAQLLPPQFMASAAVAFGLIVYVASLLKPIREITELADPFFETRDPTRRENGPFAFFGRTEGKVGVALLALSIAISFAQVSMQIRLNLWYRDLFDALQQYDAAKFWFQLLGVFAPLAAVWITIAIFDVLVDNSLHIRWRGWMTRSIYGRWLHGATHYRMSFAGAETDNPDQRISADIRSYIVQTMSLSIRLLQQLATLVSFIVLLWGLSRDFVFPWLEVKIPGLLVWIAIVYAFVGTAVAHWIGQPLVRLNFQQERYEADFRFALARTREYGEQIALMHGEGAERERLEARFTGIIDIFMAVLWRTMKFTTFNGFYNQISVVFPYILAAPSYFLKQITLGQFQQTARAFSNVSDALSFFINSYQTLAAYKANIDRLTTFNHAMARVEAAETKHGDFAFGESHAGKLTALGMTLSVPNGRTLLSGADFAFAPRQSTLLTGKSGSGKSTLFRALAGIWPFGRGEVRVPAGERLLVLPQRPYIPHATLRVAATYPAVEGTFADAEIRAALEAVGLAALGEELDREDIWQQRLSGGEQQRLAIARAILARPDWLLLDEATAALDEPSEKAIYEAIFANLPGTTVISVGHRSTLIDLHARHIDLRDGLKGFAPFEMKTTPAPA